MAQRPVGSAGPVTSAERIQVVDILRGFALLGILLVNMALFKAPWMPGMPSATTDATLFDRIAALAIDLFAEGKFFTLFSFLFGLGFAIQMIRAQERGTPFVPRFMRRLLVLLAIGIAHVVLFWFGDILVTYALTGFVLLLFRNRMPRTLLIWSGALLLIMTLLLSVGAGLMHYAATLPGEQAGMAAAEADMLAQSIAESEHNLAVYGNGTFLAIMAERLGDYVGMLFGLVFMLPSVLAMFLLGLYAGKRGILHNVPAHLTLLRRIRFWGLTLGLISTAAIVYAQTNFALFGAMLAEPLHFSLSGPFLAMGYAATIVLLVQDERWRARLSPLGMAGRMALTNYLMQTVICTTIFYGYGLGLYGEVGAAAGLLLSFVIYALQIPLSMWWLRRFQFGPMEWLWRSLTYGRVQPMRVTTQPQRQIA